MDGDDPIDTPTAAEILDMTVQGVHYYIGEGRLPAKRMSNGTWVTTRRHAEKLRDELGAKPRRRGPRPQGEDT